MGERHPPPVDLAAVGGGQVAVPLDGVEEQLGERALGHGSSCTTKVMGEPGTSVPTARRARAVTTTESGSVPPPRYLTFTLAIPAALVCTVSMVEPLCVVSSGTSAAVPPFIGAEVIAKVTGRFASGTAVGVGVVTVSWSRTASESERESGVGPVTEIVSCVAVAAVTV